MALFFGHLRENGAQRWHAGAEGSSAQIREGSLSCIRYRVTAKSMRKITMTIQILMRDIRGDFLPGPGPCWGREKAPPLRPKGGAEPYLSYSALLAEGFPSSAPKPMRGAGIGSGTNSPAGAVGEGD